MAGMEGIVLVSINLTLCESPPRNAALVTAAAAAARYFAAATDRCVVLFAFCSAKREQNLLEPATVVYLRTSVHPS